MWFEWLKGRGLSLLSAVFPTITQDKNNIIGCSHCMNFENRTWQWIQHQRLSHVIFVQSCPKLFWQLFYFLWQTLPISFLINKLFNNLQLFLFKVALRLMAMKRGSLKVIFLGLMVGLYPWIFKNTFDVDICLPNNKIFIHLPFKSKFWKSRFVNWFHEFNESTNSFNEIFFVMIFLEVEFTKYTKKCRYSNTFK